MKPSSWLDGGYGAFAVDERRGRLSGPTLAVLAGIHGDEEEGVLAVQRLLSRLDTRPLVRGGLRAVAVAHPAAYAADTRLSPVDGLDLARCFPGDRNGSATERLAHQLVERVIRGADALVDLHSAGHAYGMPLFCGYTQIDGPVGERSRELAEAFGAPIVWRHQGPPRPGRTTSAACDLQIPSIYAECSGGGAILRNDVDTFVAGLLGVLERLGMLSAPVEPTWPEWLIDGGGGDLDAAVQASSGGRFVASRSPGDVVAADDVIGEIVDDAGRVVEQVLAPDEGLVVFLRRRARISQGDAICSLAPRPRPWPRPGLAGMTGHHAAQVGSGEAHGEPPAAPASS